MGAASRLVSQTFYGLIWLHPADCNAQTTHLMETDRITFLHLYLEILCVFYSKSNLIQALFIPEQFLFALIWHFRCWNHLRIPECEEAIFSFRFFTSTCFFPAAKYREEFKLIIDRIAVVKSENVSELRRCFYLLWEKLCSNVFCVHVSTLRHKQANVFLQWWDVAPVKLSWLNKELTQRDSFSWKLFLWSIFTYWQNVSARWLSPN